MRFIVIDTETSHVSIPKAQVIELGLVIIDTRKFHTITDVLRSAPKLSVLVYREELYGAIETLAFNAEILKRLGTILDEKLSSIYIENRYKKFVPFKSYENDDVSLSEVIVRDTEVIPLVSTFLAKSQLLELTANSTYEKAILEVEKDPNKFKYNFKRILYAGKNILSFDLPILDNNFRWREYLPATHRILDPAVIFSEPSDPTVPSLGECFEKIGIEQTTLHRTIPDCIDIVKLLYYHWNLGDVKAEVESDEYKKLESLLVPNENTQGGE